MNTVRVQSPKSTSDQSDFINHPLFITDKLANILITPSDKDFDFNASKTRFRENYPNKTYAFISYETIHYKFTQIQTS